MSQSPVQCELTLSSKLEHNFLHSISFCAVIMFNGSADNFNREAAYNIRSLLLKVLSEADEIGQSGSCIHLIFNVCMHIVVMHASCNATMATCIVSMAAHASITQTRVKIGYGLLVSCLYALTWNDLGGYHFSVANMALVYFVLPYLYCCSFLFSSAGFPLLFPSGSATLIESHSFVKGSHILTLSDAHSGASFFPCCLASLSLHLPVMGSILVLELWSLCLVMVAIMISQGSASPVLLKSSLTTQKEHKGGPVLHLPSAAARLLHITSVPNYCGHPHDPSYATSSAFHI